MVGFASALPRGALRARRRGSRNFTMESAELYGSMSLRSSAGASVRLSFNLTKTPRSSALGSVRLCEFHKSTTAHEALWMLLSVFASSAKAVRSSTGVSVCFCKFYEGCTGLRVVLGVVASLTRPYTVLRVSLFVFASVREALRRSTGGAVCLCKFYEGSSGLYW